jgi:hypothetical protein
LTAISPTWSLASRATRSSQPPLLRDIFHPFRSVAVARSWRTTPPVELARTMYETRDFSRMSELADALEEADRTDTDVLAHCRHGGLHVRGCWVTDLVLGLE